MSDEEMTQPQEKDQPEDATESSEATEQPTSKKTISTPTNIDLGAIYDVPVQVSAVLGNATLHVNQLLKLGRGSVVELDRKVGEAIDIFVNDRLVARGEIVIMDDEQIGVTMTEIIKSDAA